MRIQALCQKALAGAGTAYPKTLDHTPKPRNNCFVVSYLQSHPLVLSNIAPPEGPKPLHQISQFMAIYFATFLYTLLELIKTHTTHFHLVQPMHLAGFQHYRRTTKLQFPVLRNINVVIVTQYVFVSRCHLFFIE